MTKFQKRFTTAFATGAVLLNALAPLAFAETTLTISDNGAGSSNGVSVTDTSSQTVSQTNTANVTNTVTNNVNTGHNASNFNTGDGGVTVQAGTAKATTAIQNQLNSNVADLGCCQAAGSTKVTESGNGAFSQNGAALNKSNTTTVAQTNAAAVTNAVTNNLNSGYNQAGYNTGDGTVAVLGGNVQADTSLSTAANTNVARISPATGTVSTGNDTTLLITDNGAGSHNAVSVYMPNTTTLAQTNSATVANIVANSLNSGHNAANFNTGDGMVVVDPGNIVATTVVDNMLNFNGADIDCACTLNGGLTAKIHGNGAAPEGYLGNANNTISAVLGSTQAFGQGNGAYLTNSFGGSYDTGYNEASENTSGSIIGDPAVLGGNVVISTGASNEGNSNVIGSFTLPWNLPQVQTNFDFGGLLHFWGMWM